MTLEKLPEAVLEQIFGHLRTEDLLTLCWLSKDLHTPATHCLYKRILAYDDFDDWDIESEQFTWLSACYTLTMNIGELIRTLKRNPVFAGAVSSLSVNTGEYWEIEHMFELCPNLKECHFTGEVEKALNLRNIAKISCPVVCIPTFDTNLTELRLRFTEDETEIVRFKNIADSIIMNNVHIKLKVLTFEHTNVGKYGAPFQWDKIQKKNFKNSSWFYFFERFAQSKAVMKLSALCLQGLVKTPDRMFSKIVKAVDLTVLETLELTISEFSHNIKVHDEIPFVNTLLSYFTALVPNVTNLYVSHRNRCTTCENEDLVRALQLMKQGQLRKLSIHLYDVPPGHYVCLHGVIMSCQKNLVSLSYREEAPPYYDTTDGEKNYDIFEVCDRQYNFEYIRQKFTPHSLFSDRSPTMTSLQDHRILLKHIPILAKMLHCDMIYLTGQSTLSHLREYTRFGIRVDVNRNLLLINGSKYSLDPYKSFESRCRTVCCFSDDLKEMRSRFTNVELYEMMQLWVKTALLVDQ